MTNIDAVDAPSHAREEELDPKIISVDFLDGGDDLEMPVDRRQWVNLPREAKWVDHRHILNEDRLTLKPRVRVTFDQPGSHAFTLKIDPGGSNRAYTAGEKGRNKAYTYSEQEKRYTTDGDGTKVISDDWLLNCCGNNIWRLQAEDDYGNVVESHNLFNWRMLYLVEVPMEKVTVTDDLTRCINEYEKHGILVDRMAGARMKHVPCIDPIADRKMLMDQARPVYQRTRGIEKEPYTLCVTYTDHLAIKGTDRILLLPKVEVGPDAYDSTITMNVLKADNDPGPLWHDMVPGEDWFVSCTFTPDPDDEGRGTYTGVGAGAGAALGVGLTAAFLDPVSVGLAAMGMAALGTGIGLALHPGPKPIPIAKARCKPIAEWYNPNYYTQVEIDVSDLPSGTGTITLTVHVVNFMAGGVAFGDTNLIGIATRANWRQTDAATQNMALIHEIGHKLNMVCDEKPGEPDRVKTQYDHKGHKGSHCHNGLEVMDHYAGVEGGVCVMFGEINGQSGFCDECTPAVQKMDLSAGWPRF